MNLWHDIPVGKPDELNVIVEIPQGSSNKYELDKETGLIRLDRVNYGPTHYPTNYGFIPQTKAEDGDAVDVLVLSSLPVNPGTVIPSRVIGMLEMEDEEGIDTKILAVPTVKVDPFFANINDVSDIDTALKNKIKHFFDHYKEIEPGKWVKTKDFKGKDTALVAIRQSLK